MNLPAPLWLAIGLAAQLAFSARFLIQWLASERARRSLLPAHFWLFSNAGACLLLSYAVHQRDLPIALGQALGLSIYLRNLDLLRAGAGQPARFLPIGLPLLGVLAVAAGLPGSAALDAGTVSRAEGGWLLLGLLGQALFSGRFVAQLWLSERAGTVVNPPLFWQLSISGGVLLLVYALHTGDPVILLGQGLGLALYLRNLQLLRRAPVDGHGLS